MKFMKKLSFKKVFSEIRNPVIKYRKIKKIGLPDSIILATTSSYGADLFTYNTDDFKILIQM
jgi:predicted nucleic acid-binding protein